MRLWIATEIAFQTHDEKASDGFFVDGSESASPRVQSPSKTRSSEHGLENKLKGSLFSNL
jgi:hypothetical protein